MSDYSFIIESYVQALNSVLEVNQSLRELIEAQQNTILKLQGIQTVADTQAKGEGE